MEKVFKIIGIFLGEQHSGKTLALTCYAYDYYLNGYSVYSNFNLNFPHKKITSTFIKSVVENKEQFNKSVFVIDEIYLILDSRNFGKKSNKIFSYLLLQSNKRDVHIFGTAQYFNTVDKRFRENIKFKCYCNRVIKNENDTYDFIEKDSRILTEEENKNLYIQCMFFIRRGSNLLTDYENKAIYIKADKIFNLYDTRELLDIDDN